MHHDAIFGFSRSGGLGGGRWCLVGGSLGMADGETSPPRRRWSLEWNLGLFPAFIIHLLLAWAVRVFDFLVLPLVASQPELLAVYAAVFHVLLVMLLWSYWKCVLALPMAVPQEFKLSDEEFCRVVEGRIPPSVGKRELPVIGRGRGSRVAVCAQCKVVKPDRTHHCSVCRQCVLKMDHHCPWVNNCVGHHNYKFFCLFVIYASLFHAALLCMMAPFIVKWMNGKDKSIDSEIPLCGFVAAVFLFTVLPLKCMHCSLLLDNATTLEHMRTQRFNVDVLHGWRLPTWWDNVASACGPRMLLWPFPVHSTRTDGVRWEVVLETGELTNNDGGLTESSDVDVDVDVDDSLDTNESAENRAPPSIATDTENSRQSSRMDDSADLAEVTDRLLP